MGTLQSFTPLPQQTFRLLLYNPSQQLVSIIQSPQLKQKYRLQTKNINEFPLKQLLQKKTQQCNKKVKILIQQQNLIQIIHFIPIFHHKILIIRKQTHHDVIGINEPKKQTKFIDDIKINKSQKAYNPFQVESLKLCLSIQMYQLKKFTQILKDKQFKSTSKHQIQQLDHHKNQNSSPLCRNISKILISPPKQEVTLKKILIEDNQFKDNIINPIQIKHYQNLNNFQQEISMKVPKLLFGHHHCPYNPVSLILNHLSVKMIKKIMNLLLFYETNFIRYPSIETFLVTGCNSRNIICGPEQLSQIMKKVEIGEYPFKEDIYAQFEIYQNSEVKIKNINDSLLLSPRSKTILQNDESKKIYLYCFCKGSFQKYFTKKQEKMIGILKDNFIEIKFFTNIIELIKQLFKDQYKVISLEILHQFSSNQTKFTLEKKLKSQIETAHAIKQEEKDNVNETLNAENFSKTFQDYTHLLPIQNILSKKQSYSSVFKTQKNVNKRNGSSLSFNQLDPTYYSLKKTFTSLPKCNRIHVPNITTVYFFIHEKQKDRYMIQSLSKKIGRQLKNIKVRKILHFEQLCYKMQHQYVSAVVINDNPKILQQFYHIVEVYSIEDKVVVIKRSQNDTQEILVKKITQVIQIGMIKLQRFFMFSHSCRKFIIIGSKSYLKSIMNKYPYLQVKEFIDVNLFQEQRKIREVISRKNQFIISSFPICDMCNQQYHGIVKANIIYYNPQPQNYVSQPLSEKQNCLCRFKYISQTSNFQSLTSTLESNCYISTSYPFANKKIWQSSVNLQKLFSKIKQKKYLINRLDKFENQSQILFFCADSWVIEQITTTILKTFNSRYSGIILCPWIKKRIIYECIQQTKKIVDFHVKSSITFHKGQIPTKVLRTIEQSQQIFIKMTYFFEESQNIFDFSDFMLNLMIENLLFRKAINNAWKSFMSLNNHQYPLNCCTVFVVLFFGFRRASSLKRIDSINDGTYKSFMYFRSQSSQSKDTCSVSIDNFKNISKQKDLKIQEKTKHVKKDDKLTNPYVNYNSIAKQNGNNTSNKHQFIDQVVQKEQQKNFKNPYPKIYLKLSNFQKSEQQGSLRKFFISKNNVYSYIFTTQFLIFQMIDPSEIDQTVFIPLQTKEKSNDKKIQMTKNLPKSNYPPKLINYRQRRKDSPSKKLQGNQKESKYDNRKRNQKQSQVRNSKIQSESSLNIAPLLSNLFFFHHNKKQMEEKEIQKQNFLLELKSCRNIQILPSTQETLLICIENIELLTYNLFIPYFRGSSKDNSKKKFILPPFTKLEINNNFRQKSSLNGQMSSLMTHQLKLSPDHQQRFLQKFLQKFLVQQSQYYQDLTQIEKIQIQNLFDSQYSKPESTKMQDSIILKNKNQQSTMRKTSSHKFTKKVEKNFQQIYFIDEKFKLPEEDKFFILMNEFKYFSAHHLLISSLPESNMTNAYHAILLTRKGLYQEALNILHQFNPFRFSIQRYIKQLKNRLNQFFQNKKQQKDKQTILKPKPEIIKWKLSYESNVQKFYLKSKTDQDISFCYNQDSLDVVYKQVLTKIQHQVQRGPIDKQKNSKGKNDLIWNSHSFSGHMFNSKGPLRKQKKQSSIAINLQTSSSDSQKQIEWKQKIDLNSPLTVDLQTKKLSLKSKDPFLDQNRIQKSKEINLSPKSNGRRGSRISLCPSDFIFGNLNKEKPQSQFKRHSTRFSCNKSTLKSKIFEQIQYKQIQESKSSSSSSRSQNQNIEFMEQKNRKTTSLKVKTRYKSNFFRENAQQMRKCVQIFKNKSKELEKQLLNSQKNLTESSNSQNEQIFLEEKNVINHQKTLTKQISNLIQNTRNKEISHLNPINQVKNPITLFKNFKSQNQFQQKDLIVKQQKSMKVQRMKCYQSLKQIEEQKKSNIQNQIIKDGDQIKKFSEDLLINEKDQSDMSPQKGKGDKVQQLILQGVKVRDQQGRIQQKDQKQLSIESRSVQNNNGYENEDLRMQNSDMFGDEDKSRIQYKFKRDNKVNRIKCKYTLQLSSQSESNQSLDILTKQQTFSQQIEQSNSKEQFNTQYLKYQRQEPKKQTHLIQNQTVNSFKNQTVMKNTKFQNFKNQKKSPYKMFAQFLQQSQSSIQSHNQVQISQSSTQIQNQIQTNRNTQTFTQISKLNITKKSNIFQLQNQKKKFNKELNSLSRTEKSILNFKFQKKKIQKKDHTQIESKIEKQQKVSKSQLNEEQQKLNQHLQSNNVMRSRKMKDKEDKNTFTFMKPNEQNSDGSIPYNENQTHFDLGNQHIQQFHTKLINNSAMFVNQKIDPSFLVSQLDLKGKQSMLKQINYHNFRDEIFQQRQEDKIESQNRNLSEYKIYPEQLIHSQRDKVNQTQQLIEQNLISPKNIRSQHKVDLASLRKLKLNCDIRRKR